MAEKHGMLDIEGRRMITQREKMKDLLDTLGRFSGQNYELYTILSPYDTETLLFMMAGSQGEKIRRLISSYFTKLKGTRIQITGKDLTAMGAEPGPIFKSIFDHLMEARLNGLIKTREDEITLAKGLLNAKE